LLCRLGQNYKTNIAAEPTESYPFKILRRCFYEFAKIKTALKAVFYFFLKKAAACSKSVR